ncbi:GntR family transcriptional regulator [Jeotgalibaca porci]|uniref:GntR family transcriptional regulator n=3 Tax=Jeotgalibaca porci TaxID=1868793 RepID=A0A6G7WIP6_9LACT|nr:GntR family transcriptional regulator [Lactobacillales bacterium]QIK52155.1 GntR family transcriptional regulator [Jeotgalibaca porci]
MGPVQFRQVLFLYFTVKGVCHVKNKIERPLYQQIALKLAKRVAVGTYQEGHKLHARSTLAKAFNVSPETARKAVQILDDLGIMESHHGSGTYVASQERAEQYVRQFEDKETIENVRGKLKDSVNRQQQEWQNFNKLLNELVAHTRQSVDLNPFIPYEIILTKEANHLGETIAEINVWQATGATIVGILQNEKLFLSPGPYAKIGEGDTLYFVGNEYTLQRMRDFFFGNY